MIPKSIISQQKMLLTVSVISKLKQMTKSGIYLSGFFIDHFEHKYLDDVLNNWRDSQNKSNFLTRLDTVVSANLDTIKLEIKNSLTSREHLITEIFKLYELEYYSAMITLSLTQLDGIMKEITHNHGFYNSNTGKKKINPNRIKYLDDTFYVCSFATYELLNVENRNDYELFKQNISDMSLLNRHAILHGESKEFGHRINAIKSILLLSFISELYEHNKE